MIRQLDGAARRQLWLLALLLISYVGAAVLYVLVAPEFDAASLGMSAGTASRGVLAAVNAAAIVLIYGPAALAGWWLARRVQLPAIAAVGLTLWRWVRGPLAAGAVTGVGMILVEQAMQRLAAAPPIPHPAFPGSLLASYSAAVGEEIIFRLFLLSLWAVLWRRALRLFLPPERSRAYALAIANGIAAVTFALAHLGSAMALYGVTSPAQLPEVTLVELLALNGLVGIVAGSHLMRYGLLGAVGVHLGADLIWHVAYGLIG